MYLASAKTIGNDNPKWCEHHEKPMAKSTAQLYYNTFVTALNEAVRDNYLSINPATKLSKEDKNTRKSKRFVLPRHSQDKKGEPKAHFSIL